MIDVEISIVNHANRELLRDCLRSIPVGCVDISYHITVTDNDSRDGSIEMLRAEFPHVMIVENQSQFGFGRNHNQVVRGVIEGILAKYVLVLNDDVVLGPKSIANMIVELNQNPEVGAIVPIISDANGNRRSSRQPFPTIRGAMKGDYVVGLDDIYCPTEPDRLVVASTSPDGYLEGCCLLLRTSSLQEVGLFDERFFLFYEDVDLCRRLLDADWELRICADASVTHVGHASVFRPEMIKVTYLQNYRSRFLYLAKHFGLHQAVLSTLVGKLGLLARGATHYIRGMYRDDSTQRWVGGTLLRAGWRNPLRPLPHEAGSGDRRPYCK